MGGKSSKPVEISPTPQIGETDDICDRTLKIEIVADNFDDTTVLSPENQEPNSSKALREITLNVCSTKLANKSPFFDKMFSNGMKESSEEVVTLKICAYEEGAFMDMMEYIKSNKLPSKNKLELVELLIIADKFDVLCCMKSCVDSLLSVAMDHELGLLLWDLPKTISNTGAFRKLSDEAKVFFGKTLKNLKGFPDDIGGVNQGVIDTVLSRNSIRLDSEDEAYDFLMRWVSSHFSDPEMRREFLHARVRKLIRFPYLSNSRLSSFYECPYVGDEFRNKIKLELESYEKEKMRMQTPLPKTLLYDQRLYKYLPVTVKEPENDSKRYEVFLELHKKDCINLATVIYQNTSTFRVEEQDFYLSVYCKHNVALRPSTLGIRLHAGSVEEGKGRLERLMRIKIEVAYEKKPNEFLTKTGRVTVLNRRKCSIGFDYLFGAEWDKLMARQSLFFINGAMLLRVAIQVT